MTALSPYLLLADFVLALHAALVVFIVGGLGVIVLGNLRAWRWANALWFRVTHLTAIGVVVAESWLGIVCPFTTLEMWLRSRAEAAIYGGGFVANWLARLLYYEAPGWVFTTAYSLFGLAVLGAWHFWPPGSCRSGGEDRPLRKEEHNTCKR